MIQPTLERTSYTIEEFSPDTEKEFYYRWCAELQNEVYYNPDEYCAGHGTVRGSIVDTYLKQDGIDSVNMDTHVLKELYMIEDGLRQQYMVVDCEPCKGEYDE